MAVKTTGFTVTDKSAVKAGSTDPLEELALKFLQHHRNNHNHAALTTCVDLVNKFAEVHNVNISAQNW